MSRSKLDPNQIMQHVFDEASCSLKTIPSQSTSFEIELDAADGDSVSTQAMSLESTLLNAVSASANSSSSPLDVLVYRSLFLSASSASLNATVTLNIMGSADDSTYHQVDSMVVSDSGATNYKKYSSLEYKWLRIDVAHGSNSAGTVTVKSVAKG